MSLKEVLWAHTEVVKRLSDDINHMKGMITRLESAVYKNAPKEAVQEEVKTRIVRTTPTPATKQARTRLSKIKPMYEAGMSSQQIGDIMGMTAGAVRNFIGRYVKEQEQVVEVAKPTPKPQKPLGREVKITGTRGEEYTTHLLEEPRDREESTILDLYCAGEKIRTIGAKLNMTHGQVVARLYRMVKPVRQYRKRKANTKTGRGQQVTCPHCLKTGNSMGMQRWHFDNCKHKNK